MKKILILTFLLIGINTLSAQKIGTKLANLIYKDSTETFINLYKKHRSQLVPDTADIHGDLPYLLFYAAGKGNLKIANFLIKQGVDINFANPLRSSAMHWALEEGQIKMAEFLLKKGFDPSIESRVKNFDQNKEPLALLLAYNIYKKRVSTKLYKKFIEKGMDLNLRDKDGAAAIHLAAYYESIELVNLLKKHGADMNIRILPNKNNLNIARTEEVENNYTPLMIAAFHGKKETIKELLKCPTVQLRLKGTKNGKTAQDIATQRGHKEIEQLLFNSDKQ